MTALTKEKDLAPSGGDFVRLPLAASADPFQGSLLSYNSAGYVHELTAGEPFAGVCLRTVPTGGYTNAGDGYVEAVAGLFYITSVGAVGSLAITDVDAATAVYASDDATLTTSSTGNTKIGVTFGIDGSNVIIRCATKHVAAALP